MGDIEPRFNFQIRLRSVRILVIDDDEISFEPFKPLQKEGYHITFWKKIEDLSKLEQGYYDIIILDIRGVGTEWSPKDEGFGILELLKSRNTSQIIVAYSGEAFDFTKKEFYRMADDMIPKASVDPAKCKSIIDNLIITRMSPTKVWNLIKNVLVENKVPSKKIQKMESKVVMILEKNPSENAVQKVIKGVVSDKDVWAHIVILIAKLCLALT
jgi:CheY-like chemotaxis protein